MSNFKAGSINPILAFFIIFGSSLFAAVILYGALPSTGIWESKGVQLSGAAAGFVIIFLLANRVFHSLQMAQTEQRNNNDQQRIDALEQEINQLKAGESPDIECPNNFETIVSKDFGLGFSKPREWNNTPEQIIGLYKRPSAQDVPSSEFGGSITVTVTPLEQLPNIPSNLADISSDALKTPFITAQQFYSAVDINWESTYLSNRRAMNTSYKYNHHLNPGTVIFVEGTVVLDEISRKLFIFALYEDETKAQESKQLFRQLLSTVQFLT